MNITILNAQMSQDSEGFRGSVAFRADGHKQPYEVSLWSKDGSMWDYSLSFAHQSGPEEEIIQIEEALEEDDELFDLLVDTAMERLHTA